MANATNDNGSAALTYIISQVGHGETYRVIALRSPVRCLRRSRGDVIDRHRVSVSASGCLSTLHSYLERTPSMVRLNRVHSLRAVHATVATTRAKRLLIKALRAHNTIGAVSEVMSAFPSSRRRRVHVRLDTILHAIISRRLLPSMGKKHIPTFRVLRMGDTMHGVVERSQARLVRSTVAANVDRNVISVSRSVCGLCRRNGVARRATVSCTRRARRVREEVLAGGGGWCFLGWGETYLAGWL